MINLDFLKKVWPAGNILGVDIGTASIKMVEMNVNGDVPRLVNYGILENYGHFDRLNEVLQTSTMKLYDREAVRLLKLLTERMGTRSREVVVSLPLFSAFVTLLELPNMNEAEVGQAIKFKARQYIPLPLEEVTLDWLPVGERAGENGQVLKQVLLISVPTEKINQYREIFKEAGLNLRALEVESLSLVRSLVRGDQTGTMILDIGSHSTAVAIADRGFLKVSQQIDYAGSHLTQALSKGLSINLRRAEDLKKQKGLLGTGGEFELSTIMFPFIDVILKEAVRVKERYEKTYRSKVERLVLSGGGANLLGLAKYAEKQTGMPTVLGSPLLGFDYNSRIESIVKDLGASLAVALGLAMRNLES